MYMYVCMYACVCVCMYICVYVCMYVHVCTFSHKKKELKVKINVLRELSTIRWAADNHDYIIKSAATITFIVTAFMI